MNWKHYGSTFLYGTGGLIHQRSQSVRSNLFGHRGTSGALICRISVHVPPSASALTGCLFTWNYRTLQSIKIRKHFGAVFPAWSQCFLLIQSGLKCTVQITEREQRSAYSCSTWSILVTVLCRTGTGACSMGVDTVLKHYVCVFVSDKNSYVLICEGIQLQTLWVFFVKGQ